jgi:Lactate racemase N-terminal domain
MFPKVLSVRQRFPSSPPLDIAAALERQWRFSISPGAHIALCVGSRGISRIAEVTRTVIERVRAAGGKPFIVPAMGSHGGGTAEGQRQLIESYGITEEFVGAPIRASMDVVSLGSTAEGYPVTLDKHASQADHIGVVGRIKPHTNYHGPIESGLLKMMMIGLGKHVGALGYHRILLEQPYDQVVRSVGRLMRQKAPIAFGLGLVENAYDETAVVEGVLPDDFERREEELLVLARQWLARLPFAVADLLIIDEIGKDVSGSGMDTNVVGRKRSLRFGSVVEPTDFRMPLMRHIFVRGLSAHTHGNATGIGLADFTTTRLVRAMDYRATRINCLTAGYPDGANIPVHFDTDREVIAAALAIAGTRRPEEARVMRIRNTLSLEEMEVSEACLDEPSRQTEFVALGTARDLAFDGAENLPAL